MTSEIITPTINGKPISMKPRIVIRWIEGDAQIHHGVEPYQFSPERAKQIRQQSSMADDLTRRMDLDEIAFLYAVWNSSRNHHNLRETLKSIEKGEVKS